MLPATDSYAPAILTDLSGWDNYQIYDLVCASVDVQSMHFVYQAEIVAIYYENTSLNIISLPSSTDPEAEGLAVPVTSNDATAPAYKIAPGFSPGAPFTDWYIFGGYGVNSYTQFPASMTQTPENETKPLAVYAMQRWTPSGSVNSSLIETILEEFPPVPCSSVNSWETLIINRELTYTGIATVSGLFDIEYWGVNPLEGHPRIDRTLDYYRQKIRLTKDREFKIKLLYPVAHTIIIPSQLMGAVPANVADPQLAAILSITRAYAQSIPPPAPCLPTPVPDLLWFGYSKRFIDPITGTVVANTHSLPYYDNPPLVTEWTDSTYQFNSYRVLRANNLGASSSWGQTASYGDYPALEPADINNWHFQQQPDGDFGSITMDSPRTMLILDLLQKVAAALDAETYAVNPETGEPRVANLGHLIARTAAINGYRPKPDGTIDASTERSEYARSIVPEASSFPSGDYLAGRFGSKGLLMRRLPNSKTDKGWEAGGVVKVHDMPQLISEVLDQLNTALNVQESTSIQIKDGQTVHSYPNQLALLMEIGTAAIQQRRQVREIWTSSIVTQNTVNEVIAGIGLPAVSKSLVVNGQKIPYWGIQPDKSLQREISTVAYNVGIVTGQLL